MSPPRHTRTRTALMALLAAMGLVLSQAASASADPPFPFPPPTRPPVICPPICTFPPPLPAFHFVVVGDSYTSGEGASHTHVYVGDASGNEDWRHQSGFAPAHVAWTLLELGRRPLGTVTIQPTELQRSWGPDRLYFHASSGAETKHLDEAQLEDNGAVRNPPQLHDVYTESQIVYFGLGGNDAGFGQLVSTAFKAYLTRYNPSAPPDWRNTQRQAVALEVGRLLQRIPQVVANVERALLDVTETVYNPDIVVALYPMAVKPLDNIGTTEITAETMALMWPFAAEVNQAIRDGVANFQARNPSIRIHLFDPNTAGPGGTSVVAGHELGQPDSYFNGVVYRPRMLGQFEGFRSFQESFHPNELGGAEIGKALATYMAGEFPALFPNGPNFNAVNVNPQASVTDPDDVQALEEWAIANPDKVCDMTDIDSVCRYTGTFGITIPHDWWFNPSVIPPIPGAPTVPRPGGPDQGTPGGGGGGGGTGIPAGYIPKDPCDIFKPVNSEFYRDVRVVGGPLRSPILIHSLVMQPGPPCIPGIGVVYW